MTEAVREEAALRIRRGLDAMVLACVNNNESVKLEHCRMWVDCVLSDPRIAVLSERQDADATCVWSNPQDAALQMYQAMVAQGFRRIIPKEGQ